MNRPPNEPPYRVYPSGELASISADEDSGLISMNLSNLEYSPGLGEDDTQTLAYTITSIPNPEIGNLGYLDQNNNFVEVSAGTFLSIDELRLLHFQTAPDGHGITEFTFTVSDGSSGFHNVAVPYVDITSDQISRKLYPAENDYNHQSDGRCIYLGMDGSLILSSIDLEVSDHFDSSGSYFDSSGLSYGTSDVIVLSDSDGNPLILQDEYTTIKDLQVITSDSETETTDVLGYDIHVEDQLSSQTTVWSFDQYGILGGGSDVNNTSLVESISIAINPINDVPVVSGTLLPLNPGEEDTGYHIPVVDLTNHISDVDGDSLNVLELTLQEPWQGSFMQHDDGNWHFYPSEDFNGTVDFTYQVADSAGSFVQDESGSPLTLSASFELSAVDDSPRKVSGFINDLTLIEDDPVTSLGFEGLAFNPGGSGAFVEDDQSVTYSFSQLPELSLGAVELLSGEVVSTGRDYSISDIHGLRFNPAPGNFGQGVLTLDVVDSAGNVSNNSIFISIKSAADSPLRTDGNHINFTTREDAAKSSLGLDQLQYLGDKDESGNRLPLTYSITELPDPSLGVVLTSDGDELELGATDLETIQGLEFLGNENVNTDSSQAGLFSFTVDDGVSSPTTENVFIHILGVNDLPYFDPSVTALPEGAIKGSISLHYFDYSNSDPSIAPGRKAYQNVGVLVTEEELFTYVDVDP